jgi:putative heme-binding domain-containing protein
LTTDVLAAADLAVGRRLFEKSCATCHVLYGVGPHGPDLTGSNHNHYLLENIVDPSASAGKQFQVSVIEMSRMSRHRNHSQSDRQNALSAIAERIAHNQRGDVSEVV